MCGLSGEIRFDGHKADLGAVGRRTEAMQERGPDGAGLWSRGPIALGHRRLKIIDLSEKAVQPMVDADLGLAAVFNGCLYNYRELRRASYRYFFASGTEVLVKAFPWWGAGRMDRSKGMFALTEHGSGRLALGRDRLGIKRLYLAADGRRLRFASTLPALFAVGGVDTAIDRAALHQHMTFHSLVPGERTILAGVRKLPAATVRTFEPDGTATDRATGSPTTPADGPTHADEWREAVLELLRAAGGAAVRHRPPPHPHPGHPPAGRAGGRGAGDERAHGEPRLRRLPPAGGRGGPACQGGAVRAGRRRGVRRLRLVSAAGRGARRTGGADVPGGVQGPPASRPGAHPRARAAAGL